MPKTRVRSYIVTMLAALAIASPATEAAEGRIAIYEKTILTESGKYILTQNITDEGPVIKSDTAGLRIDIDLNGFEVTASGGSGSAIVMQGLASFTVRNGTVNPDTGTGVSVSNTDEVIIEGVQVLDGNRGIVINSGAKLFAIRRCLVNGATNEGIVVVGDVPAQAVGHIEDNLVSEGSSLAIGATDLRNVTIRANNLDQNIQGIRVTSCPGAIVENNSVTGSVAAIPDALDAAVRMFDSDGCRVLDNTLRTSNVGIRLVSDGCLIQRNVITDNDANGIVVTSARNVIMNNLIANNGVASAAANQGTNIPGLHFTSASTGNVYRNNTGKNNCPGGSCTCTPAPPANCNASNLCDEGTNNQSPGSNLMPGSSGSGC